MQLIHSDSQTNGSIRIIYDESSFKNKSYEQADQSTLSIAWNRGKEVEVQVDDQLLTLKHREVMVFSSNQSFEFKDARKVVIWQFNRSFYCIVDHDEEVSCAGLLFYGHREIPRICISHDEAERLSTLVLIFQEEFVEMGDNLKTEMLRVLLKRLIVKLTRMYKSQTTLDNLEEGEMDLIRNFNLLVEQHFREYHQVQDYADMLNKSPKTISNLFAKYSEASPLSLIHGRILIEVKRLLIYTDMTAKEIAYQVGFSDIPGFSRFFKKHTSKTPSEFRKEFKKGMVGKN
ncbi:MAG: helix-turn-helix domain-containing protein [Ekhidna sp.]